MDPMPIAAGLPARTRRSSDLSKHSAEVFAEAEDHPVTVTRRDGESLVLMSQREAEGRSRLLKFAAQLITVTLDDTGSLAERMSKAFPWMLALSPADREACAQLRSPAAPPSRPLLVRSPSFRARARCGSDRIRRPRRPARGP